MLIYCVKLDHALYSINYGTMFFMNGMYPDLVIDVHLLGK